MKTQNLSVVVLCAVLACKPQLEVGSCVQATFAQDANVEAAIPPGGILKFQIKANGTEKAASCNVTTMLSGKTLHAISSRHCFASFDWPNGEPGSVSFVPGSFRYSQSSNSNYGFFRDIEVEDPDVIAKTYNPARQKLMEEVWWSVGTTRIDERDMFWIGSLINTNATAFEHEACVGSAGRSHPTQRKPGNLDACFAYAELMYFTMEIKNFNAVPKSAVDKMYVSSALQASFADVAEVNRAYIRYGAYLLINEAASAVVENKPEAARKILEYIDRYGSELPDLYPSWRKKLGENDKNFAASFNANADSPMWKAFDDYVQSLTALWNKADPSTPLTLDVVGRPQGFETNYRFGVKLGISKGQPISASSSLLTKGSKMILTTSEGFLKPEYGDSGAILRAGDRIIGVLSTLNGEPIRRVSDIPIPQADEESSGSVDDLLSDDETSEDLNSEGSQDNKQEDLLAENSTPRTSESSTSQPSSKEQTSSSQPAPSNSQSGEDTSFFEDLLGGLKEIADNQPEEKDEPSARQERESWYDPDLSAKDQDRRRDEDDRRIAQDSALAPVPEAEWDRVFNPSGGRQPNCTP